MISLLTEGGGGGGAEAGLAWLAEVLQGLLRKIDLERQLLATLFLDDDDDEGSGGAAAAAAAAAGEGGPDAPAPTQLEQRQKLDEALGVAFEQVATPLELRVRRLLGATLALPVGYKVSLLLLRRTGELAAAFGRTDAAPDGSTPAAAEATDAEAATEAAAPAPAGAAAAAGAGAGEHALVTALRSCSELALSRFESGAPRLHTPRAHIPPRARHRPLAPPSLAPAASHAAGPHTSEPCARLRVRRAECAPRAAPAHAAAAAGRPLSAARACRALGAPRGAHGGAARR